MRKQFKIFIGLSIFFFIFLLVILVFFIENKKYYVDFKSFEKRFFGGIIVNNTNHDIKIIDNIAIVKIPPAQSSRNIGVYDADIVIISRPTLFEGEVYDKGVIKICDFSRLKIYSKNGKDIIKPSFLYNFCRIFEEVGWQSRVGYINIQK